jgi:MYXO-CTERM domain-containing protein
MKISNLSKLVTAGVLSASVAVLPFNLPASAQSNTGTGSTTDTTTTTTPRQSVDNTARTTDDGFDWGWLGLLGLVGLAGLIPRKHEEPVRYRDPNEVSSTTYRQ